MLKKFLRRFEKLEKPSALKSVPAEIKISKRFERLEVGNKRIDIVITDKIVEREASVSGGIQYYVICPYCGAENTSDKDSCDLCRRSLKTELSREYQTKKRLLLKCTACATMNESERRHCWVCGKELSHPGQDLKVDTSNVIVLNMDGKEYKSTDENLPLDIKILIEKIRREGYSKELMDQWLKERHKEAEIKRDAMSDYIGDLRSQYFQRRNSLIIAAIVFALFIIFRLLFHK